MTTAALERVPSWVEMESAIGLPEAARITNLSAETLSRHYPEYVVKLSPRRLGMKLRDALAIASGQVQRG